MLVLSEQRLAILLLISIMGLGICLGHGDESESCPFSSPQPRQHYQSDHGHHGHEHHHHHHHEHHMDLSENKLAEEIAEEEDLKLYGFGSHHGHHDHDHNHHRGHDHLDSELSSLGLWIQAMGCSLLVSLASLICLIILPVLFLQGKPSKAVVDSLAAFGAGAMLGDAFLHQLPHAFGGGHSHSSENHVDHIHDHFNHIGHGESHSHSLKDLSIGLSILSGIVLFLLVEKVVRYVESYSGNGGNAWGHGHHHHHHKSSKKSDENEAHDGQKLQSADEKDGNVTEKLLTEEELDGNSNNNRNEENHAQNESLLRKRTKTTVASDGGELSLDAASSSANKLTPSTEKGLTASPSNLVFGYLNLFSDGVHNFTDGMALGSAFLLDGTIGGWSRTLFLLAHELPQEVGDFGILVRSGFSVSKALFFNFLSALVALAGTALALLMGRDPGQSSLIEGFTAGGFIYIAVAGVLPEMNNGNSTFKSSAIQLTSLIMGMAVALCISLVE